MARVFILFCSLSIALLIYKFSNFGIDVMADPREEYFYCSILIVTTFLIPSKNKLFSINSFEITFLIFCAFIFMRGFFSFPERNTINLISATLIYFTLKDFISRNLSAIFPNFIFVAILFLLSILSLITIIAKLNNQIIPQVFSYNSSVLCVLVSGLTVFAIPLIGIRNLGLSFFSKATAIVIIILSFCSILILNGRSALLSLFLSIGIYFIICFVKNRRIISVFVIFTTVLLFLILISYKTASSEGRLLIYKVSLSLLKDNTIFGIGNGNFSKEYNLHQAKYFSFHGYDSKEALLAGNTSYAFNEYWQLLIETGLIGFSLLFITGILLFKTVRSKVLEIRSNPLCFGSLLYLTTILISALTTYSFHNTSILFLTASCLALLRSNLSDINFEINSIRLCNIIRSFSIVVGIILFLYYGLSIVQKHYHSKAIEMSKAGFKEQSNYYYMKALRIPIQNDILLFNYGKALYNSNKLTAAKKVFEKSQYISSESTLLWASTLSELGESEYASKIFQLSIFMEPSKITPRYYLLEHYLKIGDSTKAKFWAYSIRQMKIKIPSATTKEFQNRATIFLNSLDNN